jgi:predicted AlkP superfamily pyrophosphatase or phosphodiesterase
VRRGHNAYEPEYERSTIFARYGIARFLYTEHGGDEGAFDALVHSMRGSDGPVRAFLAQCDLDHVMHKHGKGTPPYYETIERVDRRLAELWELLNERGGGRLILVSDHGMAPVTRYVAFELEREVPGVGSRFGYFVDATMARVWCGDVAVRREVEQWLARKALPGRVLSAAERAEWGIGSQQFGDVLFLLDEGVMFAPNFFGDLGCKAMHGYWPELESQLGVFASSTPLSAEDDAAPVSALRAYDHMSRCAATA